MKDTLDFTSLPISALDFMDWPWERIEPYYADLLARDLTPTTLPIWLANWSRLQALVTETIARLNVAAWTNTDDQAAQERRRQFYAEVYQPSKAADTRLQERWLDSGLSAPGYDHILAKLKTEKRTPQPSSEIQALIAQEQEKTSQLYPLLGAQTILWNGEELPVGQIKAILGLPERAERERAWRLGMQRQMADRDALNDLWQQVYTLRHQMATQSDSPHYLAFCQVNTPDIKPEDSVRFLEAIETTAVPALARCHEKRRQRLGLDCLRPWDLYCEPPGIAPLHPFSEPAELVAGCSRIFHRMDPQLGAYFDTLLLDVEPRPNKYPGDGFTLMYAVTRQSFILLNPTGCNQDVIGLIHEAGHAFYALETAHLDFLQIGGAGLGEFPAQTMELLALPYLSADEGGFYTPDDTARACIDQLEWILGFFCSVGRAEAFRQWAYTHPKEAVDPAQYGAQWQACEARFFPAVDWRDLETECAIGWQHSFALFSPPLSFLPGGISQLGALQVWQNAMHDPSGAIAAWRKTLLMNAQGASREESYAAVGAHYTLDAQTLSDAITLLEAQIARLEGE